jgi:hypothetical protein
VAPANSTKEPLLFEVPLSVVIASERMVSPIPERGRGG